MFFLYYLFLCFWVMLLFLNWDNFLYILILMEGISITIFIFLANYTIVYFYNLDFMYLMLSIMVMEASFGLSILIYLSFFSDSYSFSISNMF